MVCFEHQALVYFQVFVDVKPRPVRGWLALVPIVQDPSVTVLVHHSFLVLHSDVALDFGEQLIVYSDCTFGSSTHQNVVLSELHLVYVEIVDVSVVRSSKYFQSECVMWSFFTWKTFRQ